MFEEPGALEPLQNHLVGTNHAHAAVTNPFELREAEEELKRGVTQLVGLLELNDQVGDSIGNHVSTSTGQSARFVCVQLPAQSDKGRRPDSEHIDV